MATMFLVRIVGVRPGFLFVLLHSFYDFYDHFSGTLKSNLPGMIELITRHRTMTHHSDTHHNTMSHRTDAHRHTTTHRAPAHQGS